jgi:hypothetical protein
MNGKGIEKKGRMQMKYEMGEGKKEIILSVIFYLSRADE